ncbi:MAG: hypothetical protein HZB33_15390 [Nitrospirae bacterium]|nr:hypothetical protein [Nitrospirota bacterium]
MDKARLKQGLCGNFCAYYKPGKDEVLACLGYSLIERLDSSGTGIDFTPRTDNFAPAVAETLAAELCRACPFYEDGCDYVSGVEGSSPCGGFILSGHLISEGVISIDDIRNMH